MKINCIKTCSASEISKPKTQDRVNYMNYIWSSPLLDVSRGCQTESTEKGEADKKVERENSDGTAVETAKGEADKKLRENSDGTAKIETAKGEADNWVQKLMELRRN